MRVDVAISSAAKLGEGPRWEARTRRLLWVDIEGRELHVSEPSSSSGCVLPLDNRLVFQGLSTAPSEAEPTSAR